MQQIETSLPGVFELRPAIHRDARGFFIETYQKAKFTDLGMTAATNGRALIASRVLPISTEEFHSRTRRPSFSLLSNIHLMQTFGVTLSDWRTQLQRCFYSERIPANPPAILSSR